MSLWWMDRVNALLWCTESWINPNIIMSTFNLLCSQFNLNVNLHLRTRTHASARPSSYSWKQLEVSPFARGANDWCWCHADQKKWSSHCGVQWQKEAAAVQQILLLEELQLPGASCERVVWGPFVPVTFSKTFGISSVVVCSSLTPPIKPKPCESSATVISVNTLSSECGVFSTAHPPHHQPNG